MAIVYMCVCVYICVYIYICIYVYICVCVYVCRYVYIYIEQASSFLHETLMQMFQNLKRVLDHVFPNNILFSICNIYNTICMYICVCVYIYMCIYMYMCMYVCVYIYMYVYIWVCMCVYMCMYMYYIWFRGGVFILYYMYIDQSVLTYTSCIITIKCIPRL